MDPEDTPPLLTPEELVDYPLRRATRGYAVKEVDDLLDALAAQTERLLGAADAARHERDVRDARLRQLEGRLRELEQATEHELAAARRVGEGIVAEARVEADRVGEEGRLRAREHMEAGLRRIRAEEADLLRRQAAMTDHLARLRQFAEDHRSRLEQHLHHELGRLEALVVPPDPEEPALVRDPMLDEPGLGGPPATAAPATDPGGLHADAGGAAPGEQSGRGSQVPLREDPVPPTPWDDAPAQPGHDGGVDGQAVDLTEPVGEALFQDRR